MAPGRRLQVESLSRKVRRRVSIFPEIFMISPTFSHVWTPSFLTTAGRVPSARRGSVRRKKIFVISQDFMPTPTR
jgi:hypothetical protein